MWLLCCHKSSCSGFSVTELGVCVILKSSVITCCFFHEPLSIGKVFKVFFSLHVSPQQYSDES